MSTFAKAWGAFMQAIEEARALIVSGAEPHAIAELVRHAHELLDIIDDEIASQPNQIATEALAVLVQLHGRLESLEQEVLPTRHWRERAQYGGPVSRDALQLATIGDNRTAAGSVSEIDAVLDELEAALTGALAILRDDEELQVATVESKHAATLVDLALVRVEELKALAADKLG